jgi:hypothetical protein
MDNSKTHSNFLKLSATHDVVDNTLELEVTFSCDGVSGRGSAYFNATSLKSTAEKLRVYPVPPSDSIALEGGYFERGKASVLSEKHVSLRFAAGDLSPIELHVGAGVPWNHKRGLQRWAEVTFLMDYEQLRTLSKGIETLASGERTSVEIDLSTFG